MSLSVEPEALPLRSSGGTAVFVPPLQALQIGITAAEASGGAARYYFNLLRALPAHGIDGIGLVSGDAATISANAGVTSFAPDRTGMFKRWSALRRSVGTALPTCDLVAAHFAPYAFPVLDVIRKSPMVVHFHGAWALEGAFEGEGRAAVSAKRAIERIVYARASRFIVLSRASSMILEREFGIPPDLIRVVPGGVEMQKFADKRSRREVREALGWPVDRPTIVTARRLVRTKGVDNLIAAMEDVRRAVPDVLLVIAGSGPLEAELARQAQDLGLSDCVRFIGQVGANLPAVYRAGDISIVPSVALEGFGLVVIEALACGTPTLVTPITGLPEVVQDLDPGLVLSGVGKAQLADGLIAALTGRVALPSSAACIAHAARFDWPVVAKQIAAVYREVA